MSKYFIRHTDINKAPKEVSEGEVNETSLDVALFGRIRLEYGERLNQNILNVVENFAVGMDPNLIPPTRTPMPSFSPTPLPSGIVPTPTPSVTPSIGTSTTPMPSVAASSTPLPSAGVSPTPGPSATPVATVTPTPTITASITPTQGVSSTPSATPTATASGTPAVTPTATGTPPVTPTPAPTSTPASTPPVTPSASPEAQSGDLIPFGDQSIMEYNLANGSYPAGIVLNGYTNQFSPSTQENARYHWKFETSALDMPVGAFIDMGATIGNEPANWANEYWVYITGTPLTSGGGVFPFAQIAPLNTWVNLGTAGVIYGAFFTVSSPAQVNSPETHNFTIQIYMQRSVAQPSGLGSATLMGSLTVELSTNEPV